MNEEYLIDEALLNIIEEAFDPLTKASKTLLLGLNPKSRKELLEARESFNEGQEKIMEAYRVLLREII